MCATSESKWVPMRAVPFLVSDAGAGLPTDQLTTSSPPSERRLPSGSSGTASGAAKDESRQVRRVRRRVRRRTNRVRRRVRPCGAASRSRKFFSDPFFSICNAFQDGQEGGDDGQRVARSRSRRSRARKDFNILLWRNGPAESNLRSHPPPLPFPSKRSEGRAVEAAAHVDDVARLRHRL